MAAGGDRIGPTGIPRDPTITPIMRVFSNPDVGGTISSFLGPKDRTKLIVATALPHRFEGTRDQSVALTVRIVALKPFIDSRKKELREKGVHIALTDDRITERTIRFLADAHFQNRCTYHDKRGELDRIRREIVDPKDRRVLSSSFDYETLLIRYQVLALDSEMLQILELEPKDALECFLFDLYSGTLEQEGSFYRKALSEGLEYWEDQVRFYAAPSEMEEIWLRTERTRWVGDLDKWVRGRGAYYFPSSPIDLRIHLGAQLLKKARYTSMKGFNSFLRVLSEEGGNFERKVFKEIYKKTFASADGCFELLASHNYPWMREDPSPSENEPAFLRYVRRLFMKYRSTSESTPGGGEG